MQFEISPETRALADRLALVPHGGTITYDELSAVIGRDIRRCRHLVLSAIETCRKEVGAIFGVQVRVGYQRLTLEQSSMIGHTARRHIRRTARKASKRMKSAITKANDVPNEVKLKVNTELSTLGLVEHLSRDSNVRPRPGMETAPAPAAKVAKEFLEHIGATKD